MKNFKLISYEDNNSVGIKGAVRRTGSTLSVWYQLCDVENRVKFTEFAPTRQDNLWQHTCFELFCGKRGSPEYWEMNITPSGAWNIYAFSSERSEMRQEEKIDNVRSSVYKSSDSVILHCNVDIERILPKHSVVEVGVSCVVAFTDCQKGHWALTHNKGVPDFHDRSAFLLHI